MNFEPHKASQSIKNKDYFTAEQDIANFIAYNVQKDASLTFKSKSNSPQLQTVNPEDLLYQFCNLYANLISELFCAKGYRPSEEIIATFLGNKGVLDWLFTASMWKNTDSLIDHLGLIQIDNLGRITTKFNQRSITLLLMLIGLGSKYKLPWQLIFKMTPPYALSAYIGLVTQPIPALTPETDAGFNFLLESAKNLPIFDLPVIEDLGKLNYGYFNCSYATSQDKYEFKKWLTSLLRHNIPQWLNLGVKEYIAKIKPLKSKPKLKVAVMLERYSTNHAMHRCYHAMFETFAKKYELVAFCDDKKADNSSLDVFHNVIEMNNELSINENANLIANEKPDIILYPSIGMKFWGIYLSQLRLAPLQVMLAGHPSSCFSPEMDYFLLPGFSFSTTELQQFIHEPIVTSDKPNKHALTHIIHDSLTPDFLAEHNGYLENDTEIKIAINGVMTKVTYQIINICKQIQLRSAKKITFLFYSGHKSSQLAYLATKKQLSRNLKHFELIAYSDYSSYMETLSQCHFLLPTLPFGGSNSNIDAMVLNKPKLFLRGKEHIYTRTDQWEWERIELDNELGCDTEHDLINKSLQLIEDSAYRQSLHKKMTEKCQIEKVFSTDITEGDFINPLFEKVISEVVCNGLD
jgi:hypothetical protein